MKTTSMQITSWKDENFNDGTLAWLKKELSEDPQIIYHAFWIELKTENFLISLTKNRQVQTGEWQETVITKEELQLDPNLPKMTTKTIEKILEIGNEALKLAKMEKVKIDEKTLLEFEIIPFPY